MRDLVLDATYDQRFDPLEPEAVSALRRAWDTMCRSLSGCHGHRLLADIASFDRRLARHPLVAETNGDPDGRRRHIDLTASAFAQLVNDATYTYTVFRDLPAALVAARTATWYRSSGWPPGRGWNCPRWCAPSGYSAGDLEAVSCHDYPTAWDTRASDRRRAAQLGHAIRRLRAQ